MVRGVCEICDSEYIEIDDAVLCEKSKTPKFKYNIGDIIYLESSFTKIGFKHEKISQAKVEIIKRGRKATWDDNDKPKEHINEYKVKIAENDVIYNSTGSIENDFFPEDKFSL